MSTKTNANKYHKLYSPLTILHSSKMNKGQSNMAKDNITRMHKIKTSILGEEEFVWGQQWYSSKERGSFL